MKLDPARWPQSLVGAVLVLVMGLLLVLGFTGALHGVVGGTLVAAGFGTVGAIIWRADGVAWLDTASWTVPLFLLVAVAWLTLPEVPYLIAGFLAAAWLVSFIFWWLPVRWWYRWVLRKDPPHGSA